MVRAVHDFVRIHMCHSNGFDTSHDYLHASRVHTMACHLMDNCTPAINPELYLNAQLAALLHDVNDSKYTHRTRAYQPLLQQFGFTPTRIARIDTIMENVSWSLEQQRGPAHMVDMIRTYPELAYVQDADRLDALGAIGIARVVIYGALHERTLDDTLHIIDTRLSSYTSTMKTLLGQQLAVQRMVLLDMFQHTLRQELLF